MRVDPIPIAPPVHPSEAGPARGGETASRAAAPGQGFESAIDAAERTGGAEARRGETRETREKHAANRERPATERAHAGPEQADPPPPSVAAASGATPEQAALQAAPSLRLRGHAAPLARRGALPGAVGAPESGAVRATGAAGEAPVDASRERSARTTAPAVLAAIRGESWRGTEPGVLGADARPRQAARAEGSSADAALGDAATANATLRARMAGTLLDGTRHASGSAAAPGTAAAARADAAPAAGPAPDAARRAERDTSSQPDAAAPANDTHAAGEARAPARATASPAAGDDAGGAQGNARRFATRAEDAALAGGAARSGPTGAAGSAAAVPGAARGASAAIVEQVATRLAQAVPGGAVTIQLEPADQGRVHVTFRWSGRELTVRVAAEQGEVAALLAADLGKLETSLSRLADPVKVEVPVDGFADPRSGAGGGQHGAPAGERAPDGSPAARRDGAEPRPERRGLPSGPDPARRGTPAGAARLDVLT